MGSHGGRCRSQAGLLLGTHGDHLPPSHHEHTQGPEVGVGQGTLWLGASAAFREQPLPGTLIVLHARGHEEPWLLLTDTPPDWTDVDPAPAATGSNRASGA